MSRNKESTDTFYRLAKQKGWRARSAFKLLQIDEQFHILKDVTRVVDLCAAPGSWSQVLSRKLYLQEDCCAEARPSQTPPVAVNNDVKIVSVDLQPMSPLPGVIQVQGDITKYSTALEIMLNFEGVKADLVVCDGAPDVTGLHAMDIDSQSHLLLGALHITSHVLKEGGTFVAKIFKASDDLLTNQLSMLFKTVNIFKPSSSRSSSREAFAICSNYSPPVGFDPAQLTPYLGGLFRDFSCLTGINGIIIPYLVCGDITDPESNTNVQRTANKQGPSTFSLNLPTNEINELKLIAGGDREKLQALIEQKETLNIVNALYSSQRQTLTGETFEKLYLELTTPTSEPDPDPNTVCIEVTPSDLEEFYTDAAKMRNDRIAMGSNKKCTDLNKVDPAPTASDCNADLGEQSVTEIMKKLNLKDGPFWISNGHMSDDSSSDESIELPS